MSYSQISDFLLEMSEIELAKLSGDTSGTSINESRVGAAIASADSLIDAYLYGRYDVPIAGNCPIIKQIAISLAIYNLHSFSFRAAFVPNEILIRKSDAMKMLDDVFHCRIKLSGATKSVGIITNNAYKKRYFTEENLQEFKDYRQ